MSEEKDNLTIAIISAVGLITVFSALISLILIPLWLLNAFVLSQLWGWFLAPLGVPPITLVQSLGLGLIISFCWASTKGPMSEIKPEYTNPPTTSTQVAFIVSCYTRPLVVWFVGWILHSYFM